MYETSSPLAEYFQSQADWRREKAREYPDDKRNRRSAEALESLAAYVEPNAEGDYEHRGLFETLSHFLVEEGGGFYGRRAQEATARYGYDGSVKSALQHLGFLEALLIDCWEDAYEEAANGVEDELLFDFEVEAAENGVFLPRRYWELRRNSTEDELEAWVTEAMDEVEA